MNYIHEQVHWPDFFWDSGKLTTLLGSVRHKQGYLLGRMSSLGFEIRSKASLKILSAEIIKSSAIEGEKLDPEQVRSSLARRLGIDVGGLSSINKPRPTNISSCSSKVLAGLLNFILLFCRKK